MPATATNSLDGQYRVTARIQVRLTLQNLTDSALDLYLDGEAEWDTMTARQVVDRAKDDMLAYGQYTIRDEQRIWPQWTDRLTPASLKESARLTAIRLFDFPTD